MADYNLDKIKDSLHRFSTILDRFSKESLFKEFGDKFNSRHSSTDDLNKSSLSHSAIKDILSKLKVSLDAHKKEELNSVVRVESSPNEFNVSDNKMHKGELLYTGLDFLNRSQKTLNIAKALVESQIDVISSEFHLILNAFSGIPKDSSIFNILDVSSLERCYQGVLAWFLNPNGSHGLQDIPLRHFLSAMNISLRGEIFKSSPLNVYINKEFQVALPHGYMLRSDGKKADSLRVDIMIFSRTTWFTIECKVDALESAYSFEESTQKQTETYLSIFKKSLDHYETKGMGKSIEYISNEIKNTFINENGQEAWGDINGAKRVIGCLIDNLPRSDNEKVRHLSWVKIATVMLNVINIHPVNDKARLIIEDFASAVINHAEAGDFKKFLDRVNLIHSSTYFKQKFPLRTYLELSSAKQKILSYL